MPLLESNQLLPIVNTTRVGSDDPIEAAAAVADVMLVASRVQHFPITAPLLYVDADSIPN